jgi:hypothetical protein
MTILSIGQSTHLSQHFGLLMVVLKASASKGVIIMSARGRENLPLVNIILPGAGSTALGQYSISVMRSCERSITLYFIPYHS